MAPSDEARQMLAAATKDWRALARLTEASVMPKCQSQAHTFFISRRLASSPRGQG